MRWFSSRTSSPSASSLSKQARRRQLFRNSLARNGFEQLQARQTMSADPLPVLLVIADQQDFYYREYSDTRAALETRGVPVVVTATTTNTSYAHPGTGQSDGVGAVTPDIALTDVDADQYSAIVFVGGWGASQYQYAYNDPNEDGTVDNFYSHGAYNGDDNLSDGQISATKVLANDLIGEFLAADKPVAGICHGVTVLAWARVDGTSPLMGKKVAVPTTVSAPDQFYNGQWRSNGYYSGQYDQVIDNGAIANPISGSIGNPNTAADDVWVDGKIITAENYDSASYFGQVIAEQVTADAANSQSPIIVGVNLILSGTALNDTIYVWSGRDNAVFAWVNGSPAGPYQLGPGGRVIVYSGSGNDSVFASDLTAPITIYGEAGNDLITGGTADDILDGGEGVDRISGGTGNDLIRGGTGNDFLYGQGGDNVLVGGDGDDYLEGGLGRDLLIGGFGADLIRGAAGDDILIGGVTDHDHNDTALMSLLTTWRGPGSFAARVAALSNTAAPSHWRSGSTVDDDLASDVLVGGTDADWFFAGLKDSQFDT